ncbi:complex I subunit 5 family protein [Oceanirhabdus seepicola]|uniref:NADH:quinone oxidoreductase/Mrp antiporter transmembrane domain-containing protein n=1 Tax=Oceanirhabdus seepicola TaxID=2828781 RepID=A0A9J6P730_9CLOT|nr:proton-conducting transporter membrane subunit [Oceanirhabdus seepicola]MCM1992690.1 hypothetical protein [Oceanirhabdus seepicola]
MSNTSNLPIIAIFVPFFSAFVIALIGEKGKKISKCIAILATLVAFIAITCMIVPIWSDGGIITYWLGNWSPDKLWAIGIGIEVDGFGLLVGLIIGTTCLLSSIYAFRYMDKDNGLEKYYSMFLLLCGSMIAFVFSGDLFNMYVMLEIMTFAAIGLTAFRNHKYKAIEASFKYIVIGSLGSALILLGTVLLYSKVHTLNLAQISALMHKQGFDATSNMALALMLTGYAVKAFLVPCHTWPPDAHMAAPSSISMLLSGVMSKTGVYGLIRILFMLYRGQALNNEFMGALIIVWGTLTMVVGAVMAIQQYDFKRLLAYSSVSQLGYVVVAFGVGLLDRPGINIIGTFGGVYHMINHATFKSLLFLCAGVMIYRAGTTDIREMGGFSKKMPITTLFFLIGAASIAGIPPFNGFVSKWLIYQATFEAGYWPVTVIALVVSVITLAYFVKLGQSVFFGDMNKKKWENLKEAPAWMLVPMGVLAALCSVQGTVWEFIAEKVIQPVTYSIYNINNYIDVMFEEGYAASMFGNDIAIPSMTKKMAGYYSPINWLILFVILLVGFMVIAAFNVKRHTTSQANIDDTKYDIFTGGEAEEHSHMAGNDLFWGLKHQFKPFFDGMKNAHSGIVNDYVLWVVGTLAVVIIYVFIVL